MKARNDHNPWCTPEGYFDSFPERMMNRIRQEEKNKRAVSSPRVIPLWKRWAVAASVMGVCVAGTVALWFSDSDYMAQNDADAVYVEDLLDYAILDNVDMEYYLTQY